MALSHNPKIVTDGLALYLDAANSKSYNSAENLMDASEDLQTWSAQNCTYLANSATAPDGTTTATAVMATAADVGHFIARGAVGTTVSNTIYTFSIHLKPKGALFSSVFFQPLFKDGTYSYVASWNLTAKTATTAGTGISSSIEELDDGWFRVTSTFNSTTGAGTITPLLYIGTYGNILGDGTSGFYMWGVQLERGPNVSKYTKTTTAAIVRSTAWSDLYSNSITGTLTNVPTYSTINKGGIIFNGTNNYVTLPSIVTTTLNGSTWTYAGWLYSNTSTVGGAFLGPKGLTKGRCSISVVWSSAGTISFANEMVATVANTSVSFSNSERFYLCYSYDGTYVRTYKNGVLVGGPTAYTFTGDCAGPYTLSSSDGSYAWNGPIYNFKLYNRALSAEEVKQNFNALRGRYGV